MNKIREIEAQTINLEYLAEKVNELVEAVNLLIAELEKTK